MIQGMNRDFFLLNEDCSINRTFYLTETKNRDWEDIATGFDQQIGKYFVFIGEIGDNSAQYDEKSIIRFEEPLIETSSSLDSVLTKFDILRFRYPDGNRDAETLLFDPLTSDLFIVSKREDSVRVYRFAYPQSTTSVTTLEHISTLPFSGIVGGDISPDGLELLLKNYSDVFYWSRDKTESWGTILVQTPKHVPYTVEPQGEAICWTNDASGYVTVSEQSPLKIQSHLYFYPRLKTDGISDLYKNSSNLIKVSYSDDSRILFTVSTKPGDFVNVEIHDIEGKIIATLFSDKATGSEVRCSWDATHGTYFCIVRTSQNTFSKKFIY